MIQALRNPRHTRSDVFGAAVTVFSRCGGTAQEPFAIDAIQLGDLRSLGSGSSPSRSSIRKSPSKIALMDEVPAPVLFAQPF